MTSPSTSRYCFFAIATLAALALLVLPQRKVLAQSAVISPTQPYVDLQPGRDIQSQINLLPPGTVFRLEAGLYRLTVPLAPKSGDSFVGEVGTIVSGARLLSGFTRSGNYWTVGGQRQQGQVLGICLPDYPRCANPEELYFDDVALRHVGTLADVGPGKWYFDYAGDRIYFYDDPTGRRVETAVTPYAFGGTAPDVTIAGLVIEKFANRAQVGAVQAERTSGWTVQDSEIRLNHGLGIRVGPLMKVLANNVHHNGQMGIDGTGDLVLVEGNEIAYSNTAGYDPNWEAGGTKFVNTDGLIVRNNFVHHNSGPGLWTDNDNRSTLYEGNRVEDNLRMGILHEISYSAIIRNNSFKRNGFGLASWVWGAGIVVSSSPDVEVYGYVVEGNAGGIAAAQQKRGSGAYGPYEISNLWVHDNSVTLAQGYSGLAQDIGDTSYFTSRNNRFDRNTYYIGTDVYGFAWMDGAITAGQWRGYGNDLSGMFVP
jgi:parallel beta-helix repeat protein